ELPVMRTVVEVGQRIKKSRRWVVSDPFGIGIDDRIQKHGVRIRFLETPGIERRRKFIDEDALVDADCTVEFIVAEKAAATAGYERGLVAERRQRARQAAVKTAGALLEEVV